MEKIVIGLMAQNRGGKETVGELIKEMFPGKKCVTIRTSDPINACLDILGLEHSRHNQQTFSTVNREAFGQSLLADAMYHAVIRSDAQVVITDGYRRPQDIDALKKIEGAVLLYIESPRDLRYQWMKRANARDGDDKKTMEEFIADDNQESNVLIPELKKHANHVIMNDEDDPAFTKLRQQVHALGEQLGWLEK